MNRLQKTLTGLFLVATTVWSPMTASAVPLSVYLQETNKDVRAEILTKALLAAQASMVLHLWEVEKASPEKKAKCEAMVKRINDIVNNLDVKNLFIQIALNKSKPDTDLDDIARGYILNMLKFQDQDSKAARTVVPAH
jgi:hypothetical protein